MFQTETFFWEKQHFFQTETKHSELNQVETAAVHVIWSFCC